MNRADAVHFAPHGRRCATREESGVAEPGGFAKMGKSSAQVRTQREGTGAMSKLYWFSVGALVASILTGAVLAGDLTPPGPPGETMHTLTEIYQKIAEIASPQSLSDTSTVVHAGYYEATNLVDVDGDLISENIRKDISVFGVVGSLSPSYSAGVPVTGQTNSVAEFDDGHYQTGVPSPTPRFTVGTGDAYNCVTDNQTGLMWVRNPDTGTRTWEDAIAYCEALSGADGRGGFSDWRLPNLREMHSLIDYGNSAPPLPDDHPFVGVQYGTNRDGRYWSSTTKGGVIRWVVGLRYGGEIRDENKSYLYFAWAVRGGQ